jgi:hypothetical protein
MQRLEVSGAVRPLWGSLSVKGLKDWARLCRFGKDRGKIIGQVGTESILDYKRQRQGEKKREIRKERQYLMSKS